MIPRTLLPSELPEDRRIRKLSRILGVHLDVALALVVRLWCYTSRQLDGGDLVQHDPEDLAEAAGYAGNGADLAGALIDSLLAEKIDGGLRLVLYHEANDAYITERDYNIARLREWRAKNRGKPNGNANAVANGDANPSSDLVLSGLVLSDRVGEQDAPPTPPPGGPRVRSRSPRPGTKAAETDELLRLGSHRGTPDLDDDGGLRQNQRTEIAANYRRAADQLRAQGDHAKADDYARKADELDAKGSPAAMGRCALREG